ncbi:MAG: hydantoinase/oxoprolinase family protein [Planctomycetes bacterium]|nr:hydantoinase/oxoprolinase family protein [Planctomycetota bacterium]
MTSESRKSAGPVVGVDTGGTFTDLVALDGSEVRFEKVPSTPDDPARALLDGLERLGLRGRARVVHGTTVALNALLTGRVARTALVTNAGFADLLEIARQDRPDLYALHPRKPAALVPRERRFEIAQRSWPALEGGALEHVRTPSARELARLRRDVGRCRPESIAVCLLHSYADPRIEQRVADSLRALGVPLTTSAALVREHREFERFSTAVVNAALVPVVRDYLEHLARALRGTPLELLRSSGGTSSAELAAREPVRVIASGPAGGVLGAARAAREAGLATMVSLDMGGTSTDVAFRRLERARGVEQVPSSSIAGYPIAVPSLDLHTIGCGGGSLVRVDASGVLTVGPQSAGAVPGPVCYGHGDEPTITDAHVLLGHVASGAFLSGRLELDHDAVERAFEKLGRKLKLAPRRVAQAALDVARAAMRRALGVMTLQRGEDPRRTPLVAFGGAGGLHAADLARSLAMPAALVPLGPGVLSALGMASAAPSAESSRAVLAPLARSSRAELRREFARLSASVRDELRESGVAARQVELECALDLRYAGQSFELRVPFDGTDPASRFEARHRELYGYTLEEREIELVSLRARGSAITPLPRPRRYVERAAPRAATLAERRAWFGGRAALARVVERAQLAPGHRVEGPAILQEFSGTTLVPPGAQALVVHGGHVLLRRA